MKIVVVSNMFPDNKHPAYGVFVKKFCDQLITLDVSYSLSVMHKADSRFFKVLGYLYFYVATFLRLLITNYDVVYVHYSSHSSLPVLLAHKIRKKPLVTNVHGSDVVPENSEQEKMQKYTKAILKISNKIVTPSEYFKQYVMKKYAVEASKIFVYPSGGVDPQIFHTYDNSILADKIGLDTSLCTFGMAGRISEGKGWDTYLKAIKQFKDQGYNANFVLIGSGPQNLELIRLVKELSLETDILKIDLLPQTELATYYSLFDFFVFPTKREGESLGLVAIEAMACGTPVIASDFSAPKYYIKDEYNGFKFQCNNFNELSSLLIKCLEIKNNEKQINNLCQGAVKTSMAYYPINTQDSLRIILED